jgi:hypothetical protein
MNDVVEKIARAVLYEGHLLYPYRRSALKNRQPWSFGTLVPEAWGSTADPFQFRVECLGRTTSETRLTVKLRFLHLTQERGQSEFVAYGESTEHVVPAPELLIVDLLKRPVRLAFSFPASTSDARRCAWRAVSGELGIFAEPISSEAAKIVVTVRNTTLVPTTASRDEALLHSLVAAHAALEVSNGEFISLLDPPTEFAAAASACANAGVYPVLVGKPGERNQMLASPIILYDYPEVAPESPGDFFDSTEMDEMLSLRVLTLSDEEKEEIRKSNDRARAILERTETMPPEQLLKVHGVLRGLRHVEDKS